MLILKLLQYEYETYIQQRNNSNWILWTQTKNMKNSRILNTINDIQKKEYEEEVKAKQDTGEKEDIEEEDHEEKGKAITSFPTKCPSCHEMSETKILTTDIPHFKQVIFMSLNCENCGFKSNEVKGSSGPIENFGTKITLFVKDIADLTRDVIKSDTAGIKIPEIELELEEGGLGGVYTTVEGLLLKIYNQLSNVFTNDLLDADVGVGDRSTILSKEQDSSGNCGNSYLKVLQKIKSMSQGKILPFTVIITDPLSKSFVSPTPRKNNKNVPSCFENDENSTCEECSLIITRYERSHEQNEILGLNDVNNI